LRYILILPLLTVMALAGTIQPELQREMTSSEMDLIPVFIVVQGELDTEWIEAVTADMTREERQEFVVEALKDRAAISQAPVLEQLDGYTSFDVSNINTLWLANSIYCEASPEVIAAMAARDDVILVEKGTYQNSGLIEPVEVREPTPEERGRAIVWSVTLINADDVWALGYNGDGIIVGVIDTGTDYNHMDLHNNMWHDTPNGYHYGYDFYDDDYDPMDTYGHGTHCSGSVLGDGSEGTETGVAPAATCMALRINYYSGGEYTWVQAMEFGTDYGADVLSMSLGSGQGNTTLRTAEENLLVAGVYHSVAAGNSGSGSGTILSSGDSPPPWFHPDQSYHGGQSAVVTVGATNSSDNIASFSSRGPVTCWTDYNSSHPLIDPDICGPGVDVLSTQMGGGYTTMSGTSMATPHLAGVVALILDANPNLTVAKIDSILECTAVELGSSGKDNTYGSGRVDALAAVQAALAVGVAGDGQTGPAELLISSVNPNPVSGLASFEIYTASPGVADVAVFDVAGRRVATIGSQELSEGAHAYTWMVPDAIGNGIYFVRATVEGTTVTSRMAVVR
jgi:serine protease AprX